jgi:hypothetical protein
MARTVTLGLRLVASVFRSGLLVPVKHVLAKGRFDHCFASWFFAILILGVISIGQFWG